MKSKKKLKALPAAAEKSEAEPTSSGKASSRKVSSGMASIEKPINEKASTEKVPRSKPSQDTKEPSAVELNSIEKVLDFRKSEGGEGTEEFLCKFRGLAHVHSKWLTTEAIQQDGRLSLQRMQQFQRRREVLPSRPA